MAQLAYKPADFRSPASIAKPQANAPIRIFRDSRFRNVVSETAYATNREMVDALERVIPPTSNFDRQIFQALRDTDRARFVYRSWPSYAPFMGSPIMRRGDLVVQNNEISVSSAPFIVVHLLKLLGNLEGKNILQNGFGRGYMTEPLGKLKGPKGWIYASEKDRMFSSLAVESIAMGNHGRELLETIKMFPSTTDALKQIQLDKVELDAIIFCCSVDLQTLQRFGHYVHKRGVVVAPVDFGFGWDYLTKYLPGANTAIVLDNIPRQFLPFEPEVPAPQAEPAMA